MPPCIINGVLGAIELVITFSPPFLVHIYKAKSYTKKKGKALRRSINLYISCALQVAHIRALAGLQELVPFQVCQRLKSATG
jgi:hypothetical protein